MKVTAWVCKILYTIINQESECVHCSEYKYSSFLRLLRHFLFSMKEGIIVKLLFHFQDTSHTVLGNQDQRVIYKQCWHFSVQWDIFIKDKTMKYLRPTHSSHFLWCKWKPVKICDNRDNEVWIFDLVDIILSSSPLHQPNDLDHFVLLWIILIWVKKKDHLIIYE